MKRQATHQRFGFIIGLKSWETAHALPYGNFLYTTGQQSACILLRQKFMLNHIFLSFFALFDALIILFNLEILEFSLLNRIITRKFQIADHLFSAWIIVIYMLLSLLVIRLNLLIFCKILLRVDWYLLRTSFIKFTFFKHLHRVTRKNLDYF
jgi:hypothetical protein